MPSLEINTVSKLYELCRPADQATLASKLIEMFGNNDRNSKICLSYEKIITPIVVSDQDIDSLAYFYVNGTYNKKQLVPINYISVSTRRVKKSISAQSIQIRFNNNTTPQSKTIYLNKSVLTNPNDTQLHYYSYILPGQIDIPDVIFYSDSLNIVNAGRPTSLLTNRFNNITYAYVNIEQEVASGNIDNLVFGINNDGTNDSHLFYAATTDGSNLSCAQSVGFTPVVPNNSTGTNTYTSVNLTEDTQYTYVIKNVTFPASLSSQTSGCVRGYETISYVYAKEPDQVDSNIYFDDFVNCNPKTRKTDVTLQIVENNNNSYNLTAQYSTGYPTKTLTRYFANLPDLKGHCIVNFKQWQDPGNTTNYPYGIDCIRKEFDFTSQKNITSMTLTLDSDRNNDRTEFNYGDDIYALWTINPFGAWCDPSSITMQNIRLIDEYKNNSMFLFDATYSVASVIVKLNSFVTGTNTAKITAGGKQCTLNYTVNQMLYVEKLRGNYDGVIDEEDDTLIHVYSSEYLKLTNFSSSSRSICFIGKPIGDSAESSNPYVVKPVIYDATTMNEVGNVSSPVITGYLKPVTLEAHKSYYVKCNVYSQVNGDNNEQDQIEYGSSVTYPLYCDITEGLSGTGTTLGTLSWVISDNNYSAPDEVDYSSINITRGDVYESVRNYSSNDSWRIVEDDDTSDIINTIEHHKIVIKFSGSVKIKSIYIETNYKGSSSNNFANPTVTGSWVNQDIDCIEFKTAPVTEITIMDYKYGIMLFPTWNDVYENLSSEDIERIDELWNSNNTENSAIFKIENNIEIIFDDADETTKNVQLVNYIVYDGR